MKKMTCCCVTTFVLILVVASFSFCEEIISYRGKGKIDQSVEFKRKEFEISKARITLKRIFMRHHYQLLRCKVKELVAQYGFRKIFIYYFFLSIIPGPLSFSIIDIFIKVRNSIGDHSIRYLTLKELRRY